jgi:multiple sugar transport system substrate-binding protein
MGPIVSQRSWTRALALLAAFSLVLVACPAEEDPDDPDEVADAEIVWFSTQLVPVEEAEAVRRVILDDFEGEIEFVGAEYAAWADRIRAEVEADSGTVDVLGSLHGDYAALGTDALVPLDDLMEELEDRNFPEAFVELSRIGTDEHFYIPWMQATYIMVAHEDALEFLPDGADLDSITYDEVLEWAEAMHDETGNPMFGLPGGEGGLLHRFFQGHLIPSFSGGLLSTWTSPEAQEGWQWLVDIWEHAHPQSDRYEFMEEPLLGGEIWVAWDHVARLIGPLEQSPDEFVAFPSPIGPEGLGYMPVLAGLGIPVTSPNPDGARDLIRYLTEPETQATTLQEVGFFPVVENDIEAELPEGIAMQVEAVSTQTGHEEALEALLPVGLGEREGEFTRAFRTTFEQIVLGGADIAETLESQREVLQEIIEDTGASCWEPDPPSEPDPCPVE